MTTDVKPLALDTNILVRLVVEDEPAQARRAREFVMQAVRSAGEGVAFFVTAIVLCELVWTLETRYRFPRGRIVAVMRGLLPSRAFVIQDASAVGNALDRYERGRGDFADYYLHEVARREGCAGVLTFDGTLLREPGFRAP